MEVFTFHRWIRSIVTRHSQRRDMVTAKSIERRKPKQNMQHKQSIICTAHAEQEWKASVSGSQVLHSAMAGIDILSDVRDLGRVQGWQVLEWWQFERWGRAISALIKRKPAVLFIFGFWKPMVAREGVMGEGDARSPPSGTNMLGQMGGFCASNHSSTFFFLVFFSLCFPLFGFLLSIFSHFFLAVSLWPGWDLQSWARSPGDTWARRGFWLTHSLTPSRIRVLLIYISIVSNMHTLFYTFAYIYIYSYLFAYANAPHTDTCDYLFVDSIFICGHKSCFIAVLSKRKWSTWVSLHSRRPSHMSSGRQRNGSSQLRRRTKCSALSRPQRNPGRECSGVVNSNEYWDILVLFYWS